MTPLDLTATLPPFLATRAKSSPAETHRRVEESFIAYERRVFGQTNRFFGWLLLGQWAFALILAFVRSPRAWSGAASEIHPHVFAAVLLGSLLVVPPLLLIRTMPCHWLTRHAIAAAQVSFSALLIHLTDGRIETHFHVFGSLAFLALYRDWRVLITATIVVALDHLLRGIWYPVSVYGVPYATVWRTFEHAGWVVFEIAVLSWACLVSRREMWEICSRDDQNRQLLDELEQRVRDRTAALEAEVRGHERTAIELRGSEERYRALVDNAPIGIFKSTRAGEVRYANPYLLRLMGIPSADALNEHNLADGRTMRGEDRERFWARLEAEHEVRGFEATYTKRDGTKVEVVINGRLTDGQNGEGRVCEGTLEDVTAQNRAKRELEKVHQQLVVASRQAGMADVATGVLHNVGNVLTSVNIVISDLLDQLRTSRISVLHRVVETFERERDRLGVFLTEDAVGKRLPEFIGKLDTQLRSENTRMRGDVESLVRHFAHIREVIVTQQSAARLFGVAESVPPVQLFEDALKLSADSLQRHGITIVQDFSETAPVKADRHKVLQILVNLLKNAKDAMVSSNVNPPTITVRVAAASSSHIGLSVIDNGVGVPAENLARIFSHGFTTKKDGHGFGLHSCVLAARDMKGDLTVASGGLGCGASFTLTLPIDSK